MRGSNVICNSVPRTIFRVCYPTTPAQYFHLLRRQIRPGMERPLVVMTPKSLLRLPAATSTVAELTSGGFQPVIDDSNYVALNVRTGSGSDRVKDDEDHGSHVQRIVLCSGKVYYDLADARTKVAPLITSQPT